METTSQNSSNMKSSNKKLKKQTPTLFRVYLQFLVGLNLINDQGQSYETFNVRNLQMFVLSWSVCPWQDFPAYFMVCGQGQEPTL